MKRAVIVPVFLITANRRQRLSAGCYQCSCQCLFYKQSFPICKPEETFMKCVGSALIAENASNLKLKYAQLLASPWLPTGDVVLP